MYSLRNPFIILVSFKILFYGKNFSAMFVIIPLQFLGFSDSNYTEGR